MIDIRKEIKEKRKNMSKEKARKLSLLIYKELLKYIKDKNNIGIYMPIQNEVDITNIVNLNKKIYIPTIIENYSMEYRLYDGKFISGVFNIKESYNDKIINPKDLDLIIVPLVAFDDELNRIGQGKEYYDRYLKNVNCPKIGVAYSYQKINKIEKKEHDVPLDIVITENKIYKKKL